MRSFIALALLLVACEPEEVIEDQRYVDLRDTSGGEAAPGEAVRFLQHGIALIQQDACPRARAEGFEPAMAIFQQHHGDQPLRASRTLNDLDVGSVEDEPEAPEEDAGPTPTIGPAWSDAMYLQAFCLVEEGRNDEAVVLLERALRLIPNDVVYACELGHIRQGEERYDDALALFTSAVENARMLRRSQSVSGSSLFGQDLGWWERRALRGVGYTQYERGDLDAAEAAYRAALAIDPNDERAIHELQLIATRRGAI